MSLKITKSSEKSLGVAPVVVASSATRVCGKKRLGVAKNGKKVTL